MNGDPRDNVTVWTPFFAQYGESGCEFKIPIGRSPRAADRPD